MTVEPPIDESLAQRVDDALEALWRGSSAELDRLVEDQVGPGPATGRLVRDAVVRDGRPLIGLGTETQVGRYRILSRIGAGGMGVVYEAESTSGLPRRVALKVLRTGRLADEHHHRLFAREIETLARLDHPAIAAIYEAGSTDEGQDWFAMELVAGRSLDRCVTHPETDGSDAALSRRERLALFGAICGAISYAHQRGVIHRDLKPSNILVDERGRPKILDFGLARLTDADISRLSSVTETGRLMGTLPYMSPEQARGEPGIDVRSDVYALGVILHELLTGALPYELERRSLPDAVRIIGEGPTRRPSSIDPTIPADIETICLKALEKDPEQRYQSAAALREDVERFCSGEPILARPPSAGEQLRRFVTRRRVPLAVATLMLTGVLGGGIWMSVLYVHAGRAEHAAEQEASRAREVTAFIQRMLGSADPMRSGDSDLRVRVVLDATAARVEQELGGQPEVEAAVRFALGTSYHGLGLHDEARAHLERALELSERIRGPGHPETAITMTALGRALVAQGNYDDAERLHRAALAILSVAQDADELARAGARHDLGWCLHSAGRDDEAEPLLLAALETRREHLGAVPDVAVSLKTLAEIHLTRADHQAAQDALREALSIEATAWGADHPALATTLDRLADVRQAQGDLAGAEDEARRALEMRKRLLGERHPHVTESMTRLVSILHLRGDFGPAGEMARKVVSRRRAEHGGRDHPELAEATLNLGEILYRTGDLEGAAEAFRGSLEMLRRSFPDKQHQIATCVYDLAVTLRTLGQYAESEQRHREALAIWEALHGPTHPAVLHTQNGLALLLCDRGAYAEAEAVYRRILATSIEGAGESHPDTQMIRSNLAATLTAQGKTEEAEALCQTALAAYAAVHGDTHPAIAAARLNLAETMRATGRFDDALAELDRVMAIHEATVGRSHPEVFRALHARARVRLEAGDLDAAKTDLDEAVAIGRAALGSDHPRLDAALVTRGDLLLALGEHTAAQIVLDEAIDRLRAHWGDDHPETGRCLQAIDRLP